MPPIALFSFSTNTNEQRYNHQQNTSHVSINRPPSLSTISSSKPASVSTITIPRLDHKRQSSSVASSSSPQDQQEISTNAHQFQQMIASRRTTANFESSDRELLYNAITRGVECAVTAANHKITEPTTFHRILSPSTASSRLCDIAYEVTLQSLLDKKLSGVEACKSEAARKRDKWASIPAVVVATVSGMQSQMHSTVTEEDMYKELSFVPPATIQQLEDYASACASIQNLLLSLHSEDIGSKWATGSVIRTPAFRDLVGCKDTDMVVGLVMIGWSKRTPRMRRRREIQGDVLRDVDVI